MLPFGKVKKKDHPLAGTVSHSILPDNNYVNCIDHI